MSQASSVCQLKNINFLNRMLNGRSAKCGVLKQALFNYRPLLLK